MGGNVSAGSPDSQAIGHYGGCRMMSKGNLKTRSALEAESAAQTACEKRKIADVSLVDWKSNDLDRTWTWCEALGR